MHGFQKRARNEAKKWLEKRPNSFASGSKGISTPKKEIDLIKKRLRDAHSLFKELKKEEKS